MWKPSQNIGQMMTMKMRARAARLPQSFRVRDLRRFERTNSHPVSKSAAGVERIYRDYAPPRIPGAAGFEKRGDAVARKRWSLSFCSNRLRRRDGGSWNGHGEGPIRAGSAAAPHECRARPAWSHGHSPHDGSRDTPADTCATRPVLRGGSVDPRKSISASH